MESSVQSDTRITGGPFRTPTRQYGNHFGAIRQELEYLNKVGKRFVAAMDRFQVHRALLAALQDIYSFSACCILLKSDPYELFIIPCYPLDGAFLEAMIQFIASAANAIHFPPTTPEQLASTAYFDAPDELAYNRADGATGSATIGSYLNIPLTVENRIIGMLSLFDEKEGTFDTDLLQFTAMIADYAAVALENVRLRERQNGLWRQAEIERIRLELIIGSMAEGLFITDAKGTLKTLNTSAQQLLALSHIDFQTDVPLYILTEPNNAPWLLRLAEIIRKALAGHTVKNQELVIGQNDERVPLTLSISAAPLHDASGKSSRPIGVVAVLNDITSNKQVERLKDEFVSIVSHELRTPLTAIKGYTQHLVRRIERRLRALRQANSQTHAEPTTTNGSTNDQPEQDDLRSLSIIQSQTDHLERLVNELLDLSRVQWGQLQLHYSTFSLVELLHENVRSVQASAEQHTITFEINRPDSEVTADRDRIGQVIGNLLDNAVKYSPHGGQVMVTLSWLEENNTYHVSVSDQGIGVSPEHFDHIFERFYRVKNPIGQHYAGIGLGLYVAKAIIDAHGGQIWLTNNAGIGSTFHFTLPTQRQAPGA